MADAILCVCVCCGKNFDSVPSKPRKYCGIDCYRALQRAGKYKRGHGEDFHRAPCAQCGSEVRRSPSVKRDGTQSSIVFCSRKCYDTKRTLEIESRARDCLHCRMSFSPDNAKTKYCGWACRAYALKAKAKNCPNCGCLFSPVRPQRATGKMVSYNAGKTCGKACQIAWISNNESRKLKIGAAFSGEKHPNWQGGKSILNNISNRGPNWKKQRERALARDGRRCVDCGLTEDQCIQVFGRSLDVDHIVPFHNFGSYREANLLSNLACRCASCHRIEEATRGMVQMVLPMQEGSKGHKGYSRGEKINTAKLKEADIYFIRRRAGDGELVEIIHQDYPHVLRVTIASVVSRKTWRHVH